jgi:pimeloyl-ACP methyl ester carboxylesterase
MAPIGRELADAYRVVEPFQRHSGGEPLTVAGHIRDLHELLVSGGGAPHVIVGHSWGAMLALAYAAAHTEAASSIVLVCPATFDPAARDVLWENLDRRMDAEGRHLMATLEQDAPDADEHLRRMGNLMLPIYSYDLATTDQEVEHYDARGYRESWGDMMRWMTRGVYPAAFADIRSPVLMLHGADDPHPEK